MTTDKLLPVPYYSQRDNGEAAGYTCNSSSCFMLAAWAKPELADTYDDYSYYLDIVQKYGDTTDHGAQTKALAELGVDTVWHTEFSIENVVAEIDRSRPVAIAIYHHGDLAAGELPYGGHIVVCVGYNTDEQGNKYMICHDPNGELDNVHGGYNLSTDGRAVAYSFTNLRKRFETDWAGNFASKQGWARTVTVPVVD